jgi:hypothetical protein
MAKIALVAPEGWVVEPQRRSVGLASGERIRTGFRVHIPAGYTFRYPRVAIAADVVFDERYLGQITEAVVECATDG